MRRPILNNSSPGQAIYEPFLGKRHNADRGPVLREGLLWRRDRSAFRRPSTSEMAALYWRESQTRKRRHSLRRASAPSQAGRGGFVMRGRRPKPTRMKALTGNPGKRPLNARDPRPEPAAPECRPELSPLARQEWMRLTAELAKLNLITHLDRGALATYCGAYALWAEAMEQIQKFGTMVKSPTGYPIQRRPASHQTGVKSKLQLPPADETTPVL